MAAPDHATLDALDFCSGAFWGGDHHTPLAWMRDNAPVYWDGTIWVDKTVASMP